MKYGLKLSLGLVALAGLCPDAFAAEGRFALNPYAGIEFQHSSVSYNDNYDAGGGVFLDGDAVLEDGLNGINIHVGNRFHKNFGVELGYFRTREEDRDIAAGDAIGPGVVAAADFTTDVKMHGFTLDGLGYLTLGPSQKVELIGTAGVSWTKAEVELNVPGVGADSADEDEFGFRVGGGAQFNLTDNVNLRGLVRYQTADFEDVADNIVTYSAGLNFSF